MNTWGTQEMKRVRIISLIVIAISIAIIVGCKVKAEEIHTAKATAYCLTGTTATGTQTKDNHTVASKREWFGKVMIIYLDTGDHKIHPENYIGTYVVEDTGSEPIKKGYVIDIYMPSYNDCRQFGVKNIVFQIVDSEG